MSVGVHPETASLVAALSFVPSSSPEKHLLHVKSLDLPTVRLF